MWSKILAALLIGIGVASSGYFIADGLMESRKYTRFIQVKGLAERVVKADQAIWTIHFKLVNDDLAALYQGLETTQNKTRAFLQKAGFKDNEISVDTVTVTDNQSNSYNQNENLPRYSADGGLTIGTSEVDRVLQTAQKTGELVQQGIVVTSSSAIYRYTSLNDIKPQMLDDATASAHEAAMSFASHAKAQLGDIRRAMQGLFTIADANSTYDSGTSIMKKVRVVTTVEYQLK